MNRYGGETPLTFRRARVGKGSAVHLVYENGAAICGSGENRIGTRRRPASYSPTREMVTCVKCAKIANDRGVTDGMVE